MVDSDKPRGDESGTIATEGARAEFLNLAELEAIAEGCVPRVAWDYCASGADDEITLRRNRIAFQELRLHNRVLVDVSTRALATSVLGQPIALPVLVAPTAFHRLAHPDGELATVAGAGDAGSLFILSTLSTVAIEDVIAAASGPVWFQLYVYKDRGATQALVQRAEAAGARALVVTVDAPLLGRRERDVRNRFALPADLRAENLSARGHADVTRVRADSGLASYFASLIDPALSWADLAWLRGITRLQIVVKGVMRADDARLAADGGAAAIIVSNHGGRQLDTAPATIEVLGRVVDAVEGRLEVYVDGGVRRGTDIVKALALGARAVGLGRPILWGLAAGGRAGVASVLELLRRELDLAMALCGCPDLASIRRDLLEP
jgi:4-hydroxymandelate oxidase